MKKVQLFTVRSHLRSYHIYTRVSRTLANRKKKCRLPFRRVFGTNFPLSNVPKKGFQVGKHNICLS